MLGIPRWSPQPKCTQWRVRIHNQQLHGLKMLILTLYLGIIVDAWAKSGEGVSAAQRAEAILQHMHQLYESSGQESLRPTTGIFNAVINAWARSREKIAPSRAEQILQWMDTLNQTNPSIQPDKYTFNTGKKGQDTYRCELKVC